jgi:hypothetical protein
MNSVNNYCYAYQFLRYAVAYSLLIKLLLYLSSFSVDNNEKILNMLSIATLIRRIHYYLYTKKKSLFLNTPGHSYNAQRMNLSGWP